MFDQAVSNKTTKEKADVSYSKWKSSVTILLLNGNPAVINGGCLCPFVVGMLPCLAKLFLLKPLKANVANTDILIVGGFPCY